MERVEIKGYEEFERDDSNLPKSKKVLVVTSLKYGGKIHYFKKIKENKYGEYRIGKEIKVSYIRIDQIKQRWKECQEALKVLIGKS